MPIQHPHHVSSRRTALNTKDCGLNAICCFLQNEPNKDNARCNRAAPIFNPHGSGGYVPTPKNAKRTQFPHTQRPTTPYFSETNPKSKRTPQACIHLFNPGLSAGVLPQPKNGKRTQFSPGPTTQMRKTNPIRPRPTTQFCETNPIPVYQVSNHPARTPKNTKRTQFRIPHAPPTAEKRETNPIPALPSSARHRRRAGWGGAGYCMAD